MRFFVGLHQPSDAKRIDCAFISVNRLKTRRKPLDCGGWIMDSGAFTTIFKHGGYPEPVAAYAAQIKRWAGDGALLAAVAQDYMCEPAMLAKTGLTIADHQRLTIERYDALLAEDPGVFIMPVLQGYAPQDYVAHVREYGARLTPGLWVGVGSVCKRNGSPEAIAAVLSAIKRVRPDLRLHGFGIKTISLKSLRVRELLESADSMAWSFAARYEGRNRNDWREAKAFADKIADRIALLPMQTELDL
jgi:hypothetical protein